MVLFQVEDERPLGNFALVYREAEHSIGPEPYPGGGEASLLLNDLNLELDDRARVLYAWGYCPLLAAAATTEVPKRRRVGALIASLEEALVPGASLRLNEERWPVYVNDGAGWICIGEPRAPAGATWLEFAPATVAVLEGAEIQAIWLRPAELPERPGRGASQSARTHESSSTPQSC